MDPVEVKKTCHSCGADVTHKNRHKDRHGDYLCPKCLETRKHSSRHRSRNLLLATCLRFFLYVLLAALAAWGFYRVLDMVAGS
jgi:predicted RNA-binding Zn-ribbon protein involved in translation (DUF1610 family)